MVNYICPKCNKDFNKKSNYLEHTENKKKPCDRSDFLVPPNSAKAPPESAKKIQKPLEDALEYSKTIDVMNIIDILIKEPKPKSNDFMCMYCDKIFTRSDSLKKHLNGRCKSKENYDELEKLKEDMKIIMENYQKIENNFQKIENENLNLKNKIEEIEIVKAGENKKNKPNVVNNVNGTVNNIDNSQTNSQINKGVIINNVQLVQFGNEDISKLNLVDAMKSYLKSTGGNIASSMLKYINLNKQYPENNNICMTNLSREIVKIHDGEKFVYKKFKNVKDDILNKILKNTRKIVDNYGANETYKKSADTKNKIKINDISLKIIDGISAEDIVREEINEYEKQQRLIKIKNNKDEDKDDNSSKSEVEREFTLEERLRIEHLEKKREGMQIKTFENIKDELYNARELLLVGNNNSFA